MPPIPFARRAARKLLSPLTRMVRVRRVLFFAGDVGEREGTPVHDGPQGIRLFVAQRHEMLAFAPQLMGELELSEQEFDRRAARGDTLLLATRGQRAVSMLWMTFNPQAVGEMGSLLRPRPGEFITFHAMTVPDHRGLGLSTALNRLAQSYAGSHGAVRQLAWRESRNRPALRVAEKLGQKCVASAVAVWVFGHRVYFELETFSDSVFNLLG